MKLFELNTPTIKNIELRSNSGPARAWRGMEKSKNMELLGRGLYGAAYAHPSPSRPGTVIKTGVMASVRDDGYFNYLNTILKNERMSSNPYFPRVYSVKTYTTDEGEEMYVAEIEKLEQLKDCSIEDLIVMGSRIFPNFEEELNQFLRQSVHLPQGKGSEAHPKDQAIKSDSPKSLRASLGNSGLVYRFFVRKIEGTLTKASTPKQKANQQNNQINVQDPQFKQAALFIRNTAKTDSHGIDAHGGNIMVRRGPGGAQLVITDPIA